MKKFLCFAAAALTLSAACQKTTVVYDNDEPQEIAVFAVNKAATKAPVEGATFPESYKMQVAAYLAAGDGVTEGGRNYFDGVTFSKPEGNATSWVGGQYWPVSAATLDFLAVAPQVESADDATPAITTTFNAENHVSVSTTTVKNNETAQYDVMYAVGRQTKDAGTAPENVGLTFAHAYSWLDFTFRTENTGTGAPEIKINSITVNGVACNGTMTVTVTSNNQSSTSDWAEGTLVATPTWNQNTYTSTNLTVPVADDYNFVLSADSDDTAEGNQPAEYGKGLLLIPESPMTSFVIDYTITIGQNAQNFTYTYTPGSALTWDAGKKYTYEITMTLSEIEVDPIVTEWDDFDSDESTEDVKDPISVDTNEAQTSGGTE